MSPIGKHLPEIVPGGSPVTEFQQRDVLGKKEPSSSYGVRALNGKNPERKDVAGN
jgi:hypothetical protein